MIQTVRLGIHSHVEAAYLRKESMQIYLSDQSEAIHVVYATRKVIRSVLLFALDLSSTHARDANVAGENAVTKPVTKASTKKPKQDWWIFYRERDGAGEDIYVWDYKTMEAVTQ